MVGFVAFLIFLVQVLGWRRFEAPTKSLSLFLSQRT
jgi:hypothetical protein